MTNAEILTTVKLLLGTHKMKQEDILEALQTLEIEGV